MRRKVVWCLNAFQNGSRFVDDIMKYIFFKSVVFQPTLTKYVHLTINHHLLHLWLNTKRCARRRVQPGKPKPRPKHPYKVHLWWAGICAREATKAVIFDGKIDRFRYVNVLAHGFVPYPSISYPDGHRLIQNNDPKHTSKCASWSFCATFRSHAIKNNWLLGFCAHGEA